MKTRYELRDDRLTRQADILAVAFLAVMLAVIAIACSGCRHSPERTAHNTAATTVTTADAAIKSWFAYVQSEENRLAKLKETDRGAWVDGRRQLLQKEGQVAQVWDSYVSAMKLMVVSAASLQPDQKPDSSKVDALREQLINVVTQLTK